MDQREITRLWHPGHCFLKSFKPTVLEGCLWCRNSNYLISVGFLSIKSAHLTIQQSLYCGSLNGTSRCLLLNACKHWTMIWFSLNVLNVCKHWTMIWCSLLSNMWEHSNKNMEVCFSLDEKIKKIKRNRFWICNESW